MLLLLNNWPQDYKSELNKNSFRSTLSLVYRVCSDMSAQLLMVLSYYTGYIQGSVIQSNVSLTKSLVMDSLTLLVQIKSSLLTFLLQKLLTFLGQKLQRFCVAVKYV